MIIALTIMAAVLIVDALMILLSIANHKQYHKKWEIYPTVSILLAVRNEEKVIVRCLESLAELDYPTDKLEILIGDDSSEDNSLEIINSFVKKYSFINVSEVKERIADQQGKGNVLAHLGKLATGQYLLMTDADMRLPSSWIKGMLSAMDDGVGLAIGVTQVEGDKMQDLDWQHALGMVKVSSDLDMPITGMGNNMIVSKEAYAKVGGYENLPFSIIEDYELFKHIKSASFKCLHVFQEDVLGQTLPIKGFFNLLNQRKRWAKGAVELPWYVIGLLSLQSIFYLSLLFLLFIPPVLAVKLLAVKIALQLIFMGVIKKRLNLSYPLMPILCYDIYAFIISVATSIYFLLPFRVKWKGRVY